MSANATTAKTILGFGALIIAMGVIFSVKDKPFKTIIGSEKLEDEVTLSVTFDPEVRTAYPVRIEAFMNGISLFQPFPRIKSPWNYSTKVHKGAEIFLTAAQVHDGQLDCIITHKGKTVVHDSTVNGDDPFVVVCWYQIGE